MNTKMSLNEIPTVSMAFDFLDRYMVFFSFEKKNVKLVFILCKVASTVWATGYLRCLLRNGRKLLLPTSHYFE